MVELPSYMLHLAAWWSRIEWLLSPLHMVADRLGRSSVGHKLYHGSHWCANCAVLTSVHLCGHGWESITAGILLATIVIGLVFFKDMNKIFGELHLKSSGFSSEGIPSPKGAKVHINMSRVQEIHPNQDGGSILTMNIPNYNLWVSETQDEIMAQIARMNSGLSDKELIALRLVLDYHSDNESETFMDIEYFRSALKKMGVV
jgi:hypothetical protein